MTRGLATQEPVNTHDAGPHAVGRITPESLQDGPESILAHREILEALALHVAPWASLEVLRALGCGFWTICASLFNLPRDVSVNAPFEVKAWPDLATACAFSNTTTAEQLDAMYKACLRSAVLNEADVTTLVLGTGPGSFTGLRLGAAYANGLAFGRARTGGLWAIGTFPLAPARAVLAGRGLDGVACARVLGATEEDSDQRDAYASLVSPFDLLAALFLCAVHNPDGSDPRSAVRVDSFVPAYGREPGPVLKLKGLVP